MVDTGSTISDLESDSPSPQPRVDRLFSEDFCPLERAVHTAPTISKHLKPMYLQFYKKQLFIMSATISDDNDRIVPDDGNLQKRFDMDIITSSVLDRLTSEFLHHLQGKLKLKDYRKPRYIFVNNTVKPVLLNFMPGDAESVKKLWFDGTAMNLKASLKCSLPMHDVDSFDKLEDELRALCQQIK